MKSKIKILLLLLATMFIWRCNSHKFMVRFHESNKYGLKNIFGTVRVKAKFDTLYYENNSGFYHAFSNGKWSLLGPHGELLGVFDSISNFSKDGFGLAYRENYLFTLNKKGEIETSITRGYSEYLEGYLVHSSKTKLFGILDSNLKIKIPIEYESISNHGWKEGVLAVRKNNKWGFIDKNNRVVIPFIYESAEKFSEGLALVEVNNKWGYIDHSNVFVIAPHYAYSIREMASHFNGGLAMVRTNFGSGYINKKGEIVIPLKYRLVNEFCKGYAFAMLDSSSGNNMNVRTIIQYGYIDSTGKEYFCDYRKFFPGEVLIDSTSIPKELNHQSLKFPTYDYYGLEKTMSGFDKLLSNALKAFKYEPLNYPELCKLNEICCSYGILVGGNYSHRSGNLERPEEKFLLKIIGNEQLRTITWNFIKPYYKQAFQGMHPFIQKTYKEIALYLKDYINHYDQKKVEAYLKNDEKKFAYYDLSGKYDPNRKLSACLDRLIIIHQLLNVEDAKTWINKISDEVSTW